MSDEAAQQAVRDLLLSIGEDPDREGLLQTPRRVVQALHEMTAGRLTDPADYLEVVFEAECDELIVVDGIDFVSLCEHHLLPFIGQATVAYLPADGRVVGLSKIPRVVEGFARRLQLQEQLTRQIATAIHTSLRPQATGVIMRASHACMSCRGVGQANARMVTSCMLGQLRDSPDLRAELLGLFAVRT